MTSVYKTKNGFTIIEVLISLLIFSIAISYAVSVLSITLRGQKNSLATQQTLDQTSFALEYVSRVIRAVQPETLTITRGGKGVSFLTSSGIRQEIFVQNGQIKQIKNGEEIDLTSNNIEITSATFQESNSSVLPYITIALEFKNKGSKPEESATMKIQTTISQRNF